MSDHEHHMGVHEHEQPAGHGHTHDHDHDHSHGHNHDHNHDHNHRRSLECGWADVDLESHVHEQAATTTATLHPKPHSQLAFDELVQAMQRIAESSEREGGIVGHIKGYARQGDAFAHASVTSPALPATVEGDGAASFDQSAEIQIVAIVMLLPSEDLEHIVAESLKQIASCEA